MAEAYLVEPDRKFIKQVIGAGGESLKKCYQCATCSVVCNPSPDNNPFPRKEMIWAQWGLKDRLIRDPDIWLCHQCNDCSVYCPRGAKPGDVLAAVRSLVIMEYAFPKFLGKALRELKYFPVLIAIPIILLVAVLISRGNLVTIPPGEILFRKFIPYIYIDAAAVLFTSLVLLSIVVSIRRFWKDLDKNSQNNCDKPSLIGFLGLSVWPALASIIKHSKLKDCETRKVRYYAHLGIFYGFIGLTITTTIVFIGILLGKMPPWPLASPLKWLGNLSALSLFSGCTLVIAHRLFQKDEAGASAYADWLFIWVLYITTITGILTEVARLADVTVMAYSVYALHIIFVFFLLVYLPYSKFAHLIYRTTAMVYANYSGREVKSERRVTEESFAEIITG